MFLLGAWQLLLGRYADSRDVVIGSPIAGRSRSEVQELIGFFVNLLLMRLDLSGNPTVDTFYKRVKNMALGAFSHQDLPVDRLLEVMEVERQPGYPPLAQAAFQLINLQDAGASNPFGETPVKIEPPGERALKEAIATARRMAESVAAVWGARGEQWGKA